MPVPKLPLEKRVAKLEKEVVSLKNLLSKNDNSPWWLKISGVFKNDPVFDEIHTLGRKIRQKKSKKIAS